CHHIGRREQGVAISWTLGDGFYAEHSSRTRLVLDDDLLTQRARQVFADNARHKIQAASRREVHDQPYRPVRIGLRACDVRRRRHRSGAGGELQKLATGKCHDAPLAYSPAFASGCYETSAGDHSGLIPADLITLAHFSVSSAMSLPKSAGEPGR